MKRKAINDFFTPTAKRTSADNAARTPTSNQERDCIPSHTPTKTSIPGLTLIHDFISSIEEQEIQSYLNDSTTCTWRTDLSRRTMHFGGTYCTMPPRSKGLSSTKPETLQAPPMPEALGWLIKRMVKAQVFRHDQIPQYCIVNEYTGDQGISAHTENFTFAEPVVGLSLLSSGPIRFHELTKPFDGSVRSGKAGKAEKTGKKEDIQLPGRSLLVMRGDSRWKWQHEILRSKRGRDVGWKRVSLTFRHKANG